MTQKRFSEDKFVLTQTEERAILTVTCLAAFLFFNSFGSISVALPIIQKQFGNSLSEIQWVTLMGVVTISTLSFCFGRAGSILGQRRLYKIGVALYAAGAGLAAVSTSFVELLLSRAVMAIGLAMALPMSTAILAGSFDGRRRGGALGLFASAIAVGRMTGPAIGGFLLQLGGWKWIFWMNFIVGLGVTIAVVKIFRGPGDRQREAFDVWGALALLLGYPALLIGFTLGASLGWSSPRVIGCFALAVIGMWAFLWIEFHTAKPLIDMAIFKNKMLASAMATVILSHTIYNPIALAAPLYLQNLLGASAVGSGLILAILPLSTALASPLSGRLADRLEASTVAGIGLTMIVFGIACYSRLGIASEFFTVAAALALIGAGVGCFTPANQKVAFASVGREDYGVLAAMLSSFGTAAGTLGTTITVALMEMDSGGKLWDTKETFSSAQQFAFAWLLPVGLIALFIAFRGQRGSRFEATFKTGAGD
jgi:EmrB/QacA subfamily drug resistance transporter